jgi:2',3'-cyclic-nucleotide 2'-phosphodiesterase/3'-nucleotidase
MGRVRQKIGTGSDNCNFSTMTETASSGREGTGLLRILATTDLHSNLLSHDY